jgi:hypothetical protein
MVSCGTLLSYWVCFVPRSFAIGLGLNAPANGFDRNSTSFEDPSDERRLIELSAPESSVIMGFDLAMNVRFLASVVPDREGQKHA